jgi:signal peptidase I
MASGPNPDPQQPRSDDPLPSGNPSGQGVTWVNHSGLPDRPSSPAAEAAPGPATAVAGSATDTSGSSGPATATATATLTKEDKASKNGKKDDRGPLSFLRELPVLLLVAFLLALLIKTFLVQAFYIPSESMEFTLDVGDRVLVNKVVYHFHPPRRGDVIVFEDPHPAPTEHRGAVSAFVHWLTEGLGVSTSPEKDFIKRVIAVPGDTLEINGQGDVYINGKKIGEPYVSPQNQDSRSYGPVTIPQDKLFVMGDNRANSNDSRLGLGLVPYDKVIGRAFVIIWPPSRVSLLHGG